MAELALYQPPTGGLDLTRGKAVYENVCGLCHNTMAWASRTRRRRSPARNGSLGSPNRMIRIPLAGLTGPIKVNDQEWNLAMPEHGRRVAG